MAALLGEHAGIVGRDDAGRPLVDRDCRARLSVTGPLYLVGQTDHQHGLSTTLLSNVAVRAGEITASLLGRWAADHRRTEELHV